MSAPRLRDSIFNYPQLAFSYSWTLDKWLAHVKRSTAMNCCFICAAPTVRTNSRFKRIYPVCVDCTTTPTVNDSIFEAATRRINKLRKSHGQWSVLLGKESWTLDQWKIRGVSGVASHTCGICEQRTYLTCPAFGATVAVCASCQGGPLQELNLRFANSLALPGALVRADRASTTPILPIVQRPTAPGWWMVQDLQGEYANGEWTPALVQMSPRGDKLTTKLSASAPSIPLLAAARWRWAGPIVVEEP